MSEIKEGEYIRTKQGYIAKVEDIGENIIMCDSDIYSDYEIAPVLVGEQMKLITKHSFNIIDLIEVNDYVNGNLVLDIDVEDGMICLLMPFDEENLSYFNVVWNTKNFIKTIVTKELFNSVMYKVVE